MGFDAFFRDLSGQAFPRLSGFGAMISSPSPEFLGMVFADPSGVVRSGRSVGLSNIGPAIRWIKFARAMAPLVALTARAVAIVAAWPAPPEKVLDIAAGHGMFGISIALTAPRRRSC